MAAPLASWILIARSKLYFTSADVRGSPLENFSSGLSVHVRVVGLSYVHDFAASPTIFVEFGGTVTRVWYRLYSSVEEPRS